MTAGGKNKGVRMVNTRTPFGLSKTVRGTIFVWLCVIRI